MSEKINPTITDMISLDIPSFFRMSPIGDKIAYSIRKANWNKNWYETFVYIYYIEDKKTVQLSRSGAAADLRWINNDSLAVLKKPLMAETSSNQIYIFENLTGEPIKITDIKNGIMTFKPFANGFLFKANDPERKEKKNRRDEFGSIIHFEKEESANALYYINLEKMIEYQEKVKNTIEDEIGKLIKPILEISKLLEEPLTITSFIPSKQNDAIYLNCKIRDDFTHYAETSNYLIELNPDKALENYIKKKEEEKEKDESTIDKDEKKEKKEDFSYIGKITQFAFPKEYSIIEISPDGSKIIVRHTDGENKFYTLSDFWIIDIKKWKDIIADEKIIEKQQKITGKLDRELYSCHWGKHGIITTIADKTKSSFVRISEEGEITKLDTGKISPLIYGITVSDIGQVVFRGFSKKKVTEIYYSIGSIDSNKLALQKITGIGKTTKNWNLGTIETIRWPSKDGTEIEGTLRKPLDFNPNKKYPLIFVIHGGPRSYDTESILDYNALLYYPAIQFSNKGMLVVKVNYRGSVGRGQKFTELNKDNLGVGDLWDLESCIEYLDNQGIIDTNKIGCCGWSQGGYISAFVGIHSKRFKAVSVGAGIADWYTYHISNDIPQFTTHYLSGSPFRDRALYEKTAPISKIKEAQTPMLIQHGSVDQRVPLANAKELYRGLQEMKVPVELFIYPGMAHPITKPRENRAIMYQNLTWFSHYLLDEELDFAI